MGKYSLVERERKFVIHADHVPSLNLDAILITDHYLPGTSIRFRAISNDRATKDSNNARLRLTYPKYPKKKNY